MGKRPVSQGLASLLEPFTPRLHKERATKEVDTKNCRVQRQGSISSLGFHTEQSRAPRGSTVVDSHLGIMKTAALAVGTRASASSSPNLGPPRARSTSPKRVQGCQAQMYEYLFGWEEYLRRTKERKSSIVLKKVPEGDMPFKPGRSRQRPHRFLSRPNLSVEEMGWRQLLGGSDSDKKPGIEGAKELMSCLAEARESKQRAEGIPNDWAMTVGLASHTSSPSNGRRSAFNADRADVESRGGIHSRTGKKISLPWDPARLCEKEVQLFELSQTQANLLRLPRPVQRMGLTSPWISPSGRGVRHHLETTHAAGL